MRRNQHTPKIELLKSVDTAAHSWCNGACLISVENGLGVLRTARLETAGPTNNYNAALAVTLNGTPLVFTRTPGCSTSESLLAAGYGIENANCEELAKTSRRLNESFTDFINALDAMKPLLGLLDSGVYVIADIPHFPADGSGHFFWDAPNEMTSSPATAAVMTEDFEWIPGVPAFLYPSQTASSFDPERMQHYMKRYSQDKDKPRAVAYHLTEYLSVLLDGHHKAAAAAKLRQSVPCLTIIAPTSIVYEPPFTPMRRVVSEVNFAGVRISRDDIPKSVLRKLSDSRMRYPVCKLRDQRINRTGYTWDKSFAEAAYHYPTVREYGESIALDIGEINDALIAGCLSDPVQNAAKLRHIVLSLSRVNDSRTKDIALQCGKHPTFSVAAAAFRSLAKIKNDPQIEEFFVNYLVDHTDPHSLLKTIADSYWTE